VRPLPALRDPLWGALSRLEAEDGGAAEGVESDSRSLFYVAGFYRNAMDPLYHLILGDRGTGKSALFKLLVGHGTEVFGPSRWLGEVHVGYQIQSAPAPESLAGALSGATETRIRLFWLGMLGASLLPRLSNLPPSLTEVLRNPKQVAVWLPRVEGQSEALFSAFDELDRRLVADDRWCFVAYDELDLALPSWSGLFTLLTGLFAFWQARTRTWKRIRPKVFLRDDLFREGRLASADSSKLFARNKIQLSWNAQSLFALVATRLWASADAEVRGWMESLPGFVEAKRPPAFGKQFSTDPRLGGALMQALCGPLLSTGINSNEPPEDWLLRIITDANGHATPRSILILLGRAAQEAKDQPDDSLEVLPLSALVVAQREASRRRVLEVGEEEAWLIEALSRLEGLSTPCPPEELHRRLEAAFHAPLPTFSRHELAEGLRLRGLFRVQTDGRWACADIFGVGLGVVRGETVAAKERWWTSSVDSIRSEEFVDTRLCMATGPLGPLRRLKSRGPETLVPRVLYRHTLVTAEQQRLSAQVYHGIDQLGGAMWERECRALLRLSGRAHTALPRILHADYDDEQAIAYVITEAAQFTLSEPDAIAAVAAQPVEALRQIVLLCHALTLLHAQGIVHRELGPSSIEVLPGPESEGTPSLQLRLSRFEMSALVGDLLRSPSSQEYHLQRDLRRQYQERGDEHLPYWPPERLDWVLGEGGPEAESELGDVYGFGILAFRLLVEPLLTAKERSTLLWADIPLVPEAGVRARDAIKEALRSPGIPPTLRDLLRDMLAEEPASRCSAADVLQRLTRDQGNLAAALSPPPDRRSFYLGFMPDESHKTLLPWGWIEEDPRTDSGREHLRVFLEEELRGAQVLHSAEGFTPFRAPRDPKEREIFRQARFVLAGRQGYWFCDHYRAPRNAFRHDTYVDNPHLLLIKFAIHRHRAWRLDENPLRRSVPGKLCLVPVWANRPPELEEISAEGADWRPLLRLVRNEGEFQAEWMQQHETALRFLLELREVELDARTFPVTGERKGDRLTLRVDLDRDRKRSFGAALRALYFANLRTNLGTLCEERSEDGSLALHVFPERENGRVDWNASQQVIFEQSLDAETIEVRDRDGRATDGPAWLRLADDKGTQAQLRTQARATEELLRRPLLLRQLHRPQSIRGLPHRWRAAGRSLKGGGQEVVQAMLSNEPFFALHGPPGTGKTTVAAHVLAAALKDDPGLRVLLTSQSHHALDNIGQRVLQQCRESKVEVTAIRLASEQAKSTREMPLGYIEPDRLAAARVVSTGARIQRRLTERLLPNGQPWTPELKQLYGEWAETCATVLPELVQRLRRGASLVMATTGSCTDRNIGSDEASASFDWVIVEEAARAWPPELAMALVRGRRWTLIGDHLQLPAYDERSVAKVLEACQTSPDPELQGHGEQAARYFEVYRAFASLFDGRAARAAGKPLEEPLIELDVQRRMHPTIGALVSRAFYRQRVDPQTGKMTEPPGGWLRSPDEKDWLASRIHAFHAPPFLSGRALVWIDTAGLADTRDEHAWKNEGEAKLIARLVSRMRPAPALHDPESIAILSPYRQQVERLAALAPAGFGQRVYTVDGFQGREADVVIVSLVRHTQRGERAEQSLGFLTDPARCNVLFSRARKLLVVVGNQSHLRRVILRCLPSRPELRFWKQILDEVDRLACVVSAAESLAERET
jgi:hypothetical protein